MRYNGVYVALEQNQAITGADTLIELQVPTNVQIEIIRCWCSPADNLVDDIQEIRLLTATAAGTGGTGLEERVVQGFGDATSAVTAIGGATSSAATFVYSDSFHLQQGWLYLPMEDERIRISGGSTSDNFVMKFHVAPASSITVSYGIVWGEVG